LGVQSQQLLMKSQVFKDEVLTGTESTDQPAEKMSDRSDHSRNHIGKVRIELCAKSFILQVYDALARHRDTNSGTIPLEFVVHGNNEMTVELQSQPQNQVTTEIWAQRSEGPVNLLRLNFQGKAAGAYTYSFAAR
jgi:hypothetical protein